MAKGNNNFFNRISQANTMPDGMLKEVTEGDIAWLMVLKDRPNEELKFYEAEPKDEFL